ncbi:class I SAM-dependent methyltransferase [Microlunatus speluncae]|uniref:class I SAM-dependent methyltransferase n=1 Tax=Microlunatus speluncae TaxID=2594267 RepID=UPI0012665629|nr:class I SAM-dependent methyltransferase [Microlunatus speluncae]
MYYIDFLTEVHRRHRPGAYLEIGVASGKSLRLAGCRAVGVDPAFAITTPLDNDVAVLRTTSDEYFNRPDPMQVTKGQPYELAFIDGLHLFEFALRDYINTERHSSAHGMIILDDMYPRTVDEAARVRHTDAWTGDVFWIIEVLAKYRPELTVVGVDTQPTGLLLVLGLDPADTTLTDHYDEILAEFRRSDPQPVPAAILDRSSVFPAARLLESELIEAARSAETPAEIQANLQRVAASRLGADFVNA